MAYQAGQNRDIEGDQESYFSGRAQRTSPQPSHYVRLGDSPRPSVPPRKRSPQHQPQIPSPSNGEDYHQMITMPPVTAGRLSAQSAQSLPFTPSLQQTRSRTPYQANTLAESGQWMLPYQALPAHETPRSSPLPVEQLPFWQSRREESYDQNSYGQYQGSIPPSTPNASIAGELYIANEDSTILRPTPADDQSHVHTEQSLPKENPYLTEANNLLNRVLRKPTTKSALRWINPKFFHDKAWYSWVPPHSYQMPGYYYKPVQGERHNHRDVFHRKYTGLQDDRYLNPVDGRVERLVVQSTRAIYDKENDTSWRRTYLENISPYLVRLAYWPISKMPPVTKPDVEGMQEVKDSEEVDEKLAIFSWGKDQWTHVGLRWLPACIGLLLLMFFPTDVEGQIRSNGFYDPLPYRFWKYPKTARNHRENQKMVDSKDFRPLLAKDDKRSSSNNNRSPFSSQPQLAQRMLHPTKLCFLEAITGDNLNGLHEVKEWLGDGCTIKELNYIFISYTAQGQFGRRCKKARGEMARTGKSSCTGRKCRRAEDDAKALHDIARIAAREARVSAYWTDQCCMNVDDLQDEVYRISDVVRSARKIVIVVGKSGQTKLSSTTVTKKLLEQWGTRMWTWSEVLLGPTREEVLVYTRGKTDNKPWAIPRTDFPSLAWADADVAQHLIDHYENNLTLSRLELVILALECLKRRVERGTTKYLEGDLSYALMGLLRQRPKVDSTDSAFQAFARLSLANDSDKLLERLICVLPKKLDIRHRSVDDSADEEYQSDPDGPSEDEKESKSKQQKQIDDEEQKKKRHYWTNIDDFWDAKLWDIDPGCQIAGIAQDDTVIIDGAFAATVHWDSFQRVAITTKETWSRFLARGFVRSVPAWVFAGILAISLGGTGNPTGQAIGAIIFIVAISTILLSPALILHIYGGKVWSTQPWLFGFEGHVDVVTLETKIFGFPNNRLTWAPYGSSLSCHDRNKDAECEGLDPYEVDSEVRRRVDQPGKLSEGQARIFTLVDTNTMTVTMFEAERPPVVALLCGSEGGMQRAVMCSYDWTTQAFYRETVLRFETTALEKMPRAGRVKFGLRRWPKLTKPNELTRSE